MGQTLGRAPLPKGCNRFLNLPKSCVYDLWEAFNDIAEGFGLTIEEFQEIIKSALLEYLSVTERALNMDTEKVFRLFDDDENNLVDSLEFLSSFALLSGMTPEEKIRFIFAMYDFDESSLLTLDEMVLALRSTLSGLSKLSKIDPPTEAEIEAIVVQAFDSVRKANIASEVTGIEKHEFVDFCLNTPEIISWIEFFDDLEEYEIDLNNKKPVPIPDASHTDRTPGLETVMNPTIGGYNRLQTERRGFSKHFIPKKPWDNVLPFLNPIRLPDQPTETPAHNMTLDWVYGFNAHSARQCLYYSGKGLVVYPAGAVVVVQDVANRIQQHFVEHNDLITCMKLYNDGDDTIVASGEAGMRPSIYVWDLNTREVLSTITGFHRRGIYQLDFSPDRTKLVTLGMDTYHSLVVYEWRSRHVLFAARTTFDPVYDVKFLTDNLIASCGKDHIYFWKESQVEGYSRFRGLFGSAIKPEALYCVAMVGNTIVTGGESGFLHCWEGRNWVSRIKGHAGIVYSCYVVDKGEEKGLVTACSMGKIQVWNSKLEVGATFNAVALGAVDPCVLSVCLDLLTSKLLVGFKSCEVYEMDSTDGRNAHNSAVVSAHSNPMVCGIATHPFDPKLFCSVGNDKTVRIFDAKDHRLLRFSMLDTIGHCCAYSPDGQLISVGFGSGIEGKEERKEGAFVVLYEEDLTIVHEARDSKCMISDTKFSPNGSTLAMSSIDGAMYVYNSNDYAAKAKCRGHIGECTHFDYSEDSQFLMSNSHGGELLFWDADRGELQVPKTMREVQWSSNCCTRSYATQNIWGPYDDGVNINATARSHARDMIVAADSAGRLRTYIAPVVREDPNFNLLRGHSADVQNVTFSCDDNFLFSSGGTDGCIMQWRNILPMTQDYEDMKKDDSVREAIPVEMAFEGKLLERNDNYEDIINLRPKAICDMEEGLVDVSQLHPWQRTIIAPSRVPPEDNSEPPDTLDLEYVYGFSADKGREAIHYTLEGEIIFYAAAVCIIMDQETRKQRFYMEHSATITAMAVHPLEGFVATGQQGEVPCVRIWNADTFETVGVIEGFHRRAICHLKFSRDGKYLITVGHDRYHSIAIYEWKSQTVVASTRSFLKKSLFIDFNPQGTGAIHCGNEVVRFWEFKGANITFQDALLGNRAKLQGFMCAGWIGSNAVVGTADGSIYRFVGRQLDGTTQAHSGCINSISSHADGICTCSSDGFVKLWTRTLECRLVIDSKNLRTLSNVLKHVDWNPNRGRIIIGTLSGEIYEVGDGDGENLYRGALTEGHSGEELWGMAPHPMKDLFATTGDDSILRVWDVYTHVCNSTVTLEMPSRCCAYSPDGRKICIGFGSPKKLSARQYDGKWIIMDTEDFQIVHEARDSTKWLTECKFSPNGEFLAIGSYDFKIYVYNVFSGYALNATISQHQAFITNFDFSDDSAWLQSNCAGFELNFFEVDTGMFIPAPSRLRDTVWQSQNCTMAWSVQGIWPAHKDGTEITVAEVNLFRTGDGPVIAYGDNYGRINLKRYPSTSQFSASKQYRGSSNKITRMRFAAGDSFLLSLSGVDKSIFQWAHARDRGPSVAWNVNDRAGQVEEEEEDVVKYFGLATSDDPLPDLSELKTLITSRPWVASVVPPSNPGPLNDAKPPMRLEPSHIFGYHSDSTRNSVRFNCMGNIVYPVSKCVVVFDKKKNEQIYYEEHTNDISCVALSKDGQLCASAERTNRPQINIWHACTGHVLVKLPVLHRRGVIHMSFSDDRKFLVSVGCDNDHSMALWESPTGEWSTDGRLMAWTRGDVNPSLFCSFYISPSSDYVLASGGRFHQKFWTVNNGGLNANYAEYENKQKIGTLLCGTQVENKFVSGATSGHLFVWVGRTLDRVIRAHELAVTSIWACNVGVITAGKDGMITQWTTEFEHIRSFALADADVPPLVPKIRSIDAALSIDQSGIVRILASTAGGEIYEIAAKSGNTSLVQESHYSGELWGLCVSPIDPDLFVTAGDDKTLRVWSITNKRLIRKAVLDCTARSVAWSPEGKHLIVGLGGTWDGKRQRKDGAFLILDAITLRPLFEGRDSRHWLPDVKFSPDGKSFAVGSYDHKIYIYNRESYRLKGACERHNGHIRNFDFSEDSTYIQSDSGDFEHLYFEAEDGEHFGAGSQLKDIRWNDWTCTFGYPVQGIWPAFDKVDKKLLFEPNCAHRSPDGKLIAAGCTDGGVKIFNAPCTNKDVSIIILLLYMY